VTFIIGLTYLTGCGILETSMSKRFLSNFFKRRLSLKVSGTRASSAWGKEQIKKIGSLGQSLIVMQVG